MNDTDEKAIEEMARQNCHIEYHMKNYKTCKECYETNYCACRVYEVCRNLYNAGYCKRSGWISADERLPEPKKWVLVFTRHMNHPVVCFYEDVWYFLGGFFSKGQVTHWMPLPEPPKGE